MAIDPFRYSDISVNAVNQHGGRVMIYIVCLTYVRLRSDHMTQDKSIVA